MVAAPAAPLPSAPTTADPARPLPPLRDDLVLLPGAPTAEGAPTWTLHDPAANRFLRLGWLEFQILQRWGLGSADAVVAAIRRDTPGEIGRADVEALVRFAEQHGLLAPTGAEGTARLVRQAGAGRLHPLMWLLKNYLFIRLTLVRPDAFLRATLPLVGWMFTRGFALALTALAAAGLFLILRRWDAFVHTFVDLLSFQGAVVAGAALLVAKLVHELGHAYMARRFGCPVPAMGVAFMVLYPMLWTDTTAAWRLVDRRQRLLVDAGGILAELALAAVASVAWGLLPDGPLRSAAFLLAGTTWVLTLLVNLNPFMRFDGYFLLSDLLDEPNLQDRAFAFTRWWLRERLFGFGDAPPEVLPAARRRLFLAWSLGTWIYRFLLFLGIALAVYHLFFKLLGLILMVVEVGWFIVRPIASELAVWARRRREVKPLRAVAALALLAGLLALVFVPWRGEVTASAVLRSARQAVLHAVEPGRLSTLAVTEGADVREGQVLFQLDSPDLAHLLAQAERRRRTLETDLAAVMVDPDQQARLTVAAEELARANAEVEALRTRANGLTVRAPFSGRILDLPRTLKPGSWIPARETLALLVNPTEALVEAYVAEADLDRFRLGAPGRFLPENGGPEIPVRVDVVDTTATRLLAVPEVASVHGGTVPVRHDAQSRLVPESAVYRVLLRPETPAPGDPRTLRGTVAIEASERSLTGLLWRTALGTVIRESGF